MQCTYILQLTSLQRDNQPGSGHRQLNEKHHALESYRSSKRALKQKALMQHVHVFRFSFLKEYGLSKCYSTSAPYLRKLVGLDAAIKQPPAKTSLKAGPKTIEGFSSMQEIEPETIWGHFREQTLYVPVSCTRPFSRSSIDCMFCSVSSAYLELVHNVCT